MSKKNSTEKKPTAKQEVKAPASTSSAVGTPELVLQSPAAVANPQQQVGQLGDMRLPTIQRQMLANRLGQAQGNARLLRQFAPFTSTEIHRQVVELGPVVIANNSEKQEALQRQADQMMGRFPEVWRGFCRDWYDAALGALGSVAEPSNPYEARNFWVALTGNLAWAMTSISAAVPTTGAGAAVIIGVSAVGAGAGSGALARSGPPSGRESIAVVVASERQRLEQASNRGLFADVASSCIIDPAIASNEELQDQMLWKRFAPQIDFNARAPVMLLNAQTRLARWLTQFQQQYMAWKERPDVVAKAREYELADAASGPYGDPLDVLGDLLGIGTPADPFFEMAHQDIPFTPAFTN